MKGKREKKLGNKNVNEERESQMNNCRNNKNREGERKRGGERKRSAKYRYASNNHLVKHSKTKNGMFFLLLNCFFVFVKHRFFWRFQ